VSPWVEDGWYVSHNTYHDDPERYSVSQRRSWAGGGWRVSGRGLHSSTSQLNLSRV